MYNVKFKLEKCVIKADKIKYMGHYFSQKGIEIDPKKVKAITQMPAPQNKTEMQTFLGMITYVSKFVPNLAEKTAILRNLIKKNAVWVWDENIEKSFIELKNCLTKSPVLQYFDINKPVTLINQAKNFFLQMR